jgi:hypothetical protein
VQTIQLPALQGTLSAPEQYSSIHEERRANQHLYKGARCDIYTLFSNLLASGILGNRQGAKSAKKKK